MVQNRNEDVDVSLRKGLVSYANHKLEFLAFFEDHKKACDEISGLKHIEDPKDTNKKFLITRQNFRIGLNYVNAFLIQYMYSVEEKAKQNELLDKFYDLESRFNNDDDYKKFIEKDKAKNLSNEQSLTFNKLYLDYLSECFELIYLMSSYLQKSLNLSTVGFVKRLVYMDYEGFYQNLTTYRREISHSLASLNYTNLFTHYKKLLGFFYTYRYLVDNESQNQILYVFNQIYTSITSQDYAKQYINMVDGELNRGSSEQVLEDLSNYRKWFNWVYVKCTKVFSEKSILPMSQNRVLMDNSLI